MKSNTEGRNPTRLNQPFLSFVSKADKTEHMRMPGDTPYVEEAIAKVELHRTLDCPFYETCLMEVAMEGWLSFTCRKCEHHAPSL